MRAQVASPLELEHCSEAELLKALGVTKARHVVGHVKRIPCWPVHSWHAVLVMCLVGNLSWATSWRHLALPSNLFTRAFLVYATLPS